MKMTMKMTMMNMMTKMTIEIYRSNDIMVIWLVRLLEEFKEQKLRRTLDYNVQLNSLQVCNLHLVNRIEVAGVLS